MGRIDHQVKVRGYRIETGEIESTLTQHPSVKQTVVLAREDNSGNKGLVAYLVLEGETPKVSETEQIDKVKHYLKQQLPEYMIPSRFVILSQLPLTPNGKVDRKALPVPEITTNYQKQAYIAPRDRQELQLVKIWENVLKVHPVSVNDNFFDLGGHSLLAVHLMNSIKKEFYKSLPLATVFQSPSVEQLAVVIRQESISSFSPLVPINPNGSKLPIFSIHPAGGTAFCYFELAQLLGSEQPFYGLQALGLEKGQEPLIRIEDMSTLYLSAIRQVQQNGPYILLGWSFGGYVALQMANELTTQGEQVAFLGLLDTYAPSELPDEAIFLEPEEIFIQLFGETVSLPPKEFQKLTPEEKTVFILKQVRQANMVPLDFEVEDIKRLLEVFSLNTKAVRGYSPPAYPGAMTLFRAEKGSLAFSEEVFAAMEQTLGWAKKIVGKVEVETVPGYHEDILSQPNVTTMAQKLQVCIEKAFNKGAISMANTSNFFDK